MKRGSRFSLSPIHSGSEYINRNKNRNKKILEDGYLKLYCNNSVYNCYLTESDI